LIEFISAGLV